MTTTVLLIRHTAHELGAETLPGRKPGVHLSTEGRADASALARRLAAAPVRAIYSSPLERARETTEPLAELLGLRIGVSEALNEIDYGDWTGRTFADLRRQEGWRDWNSLRSTSRPPGGETMLQVQARVVAEIDRLGREHDGGCIALFTHGDTIRGALAHFLGVHLDLFQRIEIAMGSTSVVRLDEHGPVVRCMNHTGAPLPPIG